MTEVSMIASLLHDVRRIVILFGGFFIGIHVAVLLHESGHALGHWISGGTVTRFVMEAPLPAGHVRGTGPNEFRHFWVWGGVIFGSVIAMIPLTIARWLGRQPLKRFAVLMIAAFCLGHNGMYLFIGGIIPFADASDMINLGASRWLLFSLGVPLIVGFIYVLTGAIQIVGLRSMESVWKWIMIVECGLLTLPVVMVTSMFFMPVPASVRSPTIAFVTCYAICFCIAAYRARAATAIADAGTQAILINQKWSAPCALILAAVALVLAEFLAFGRS